MDMSLASSYIQSHISVLPVAKEQQFYYEQ